MGMTGIAQNVYDALFTNTTNVYFFDAVINILIAFVVGFIISSVYRITYKGYSYSSSFVNTVVIITMVTAIVIMIIGDNLARAFGLVGAMSIIRFRAAVKDTRDIAFVFFGLAAGMAVGAGSIMLAMVGTILISIIILILYYTNYGYIYHKELILRFWMQAELNDEQPYLPVFKKYLSQHSLMYMRSARLGQFLEVSFSIRFKREDDQQAFISELSAREGIERVSLIMGEESDTY